MKIQATVITGFLGSGKTTLIRHLIVRAEGRRLALIINEFGDLGFDREALLGDDGMGGENGECGVPGCKEDDIVELANGCICCTVADDFLPTITALMDRKEPPEHIIIETSGLALPKPLLKAFTWPEVRSRVTVDGVLTVIDAAAVAAGRFADDPQAVAHQRAADLMLDHDNPLEEVFGDQLSCADLVILNKTDLLAQEELESVQRDLAESLRPGVKMVATREGQIEPRIVLGLDAAAEDDLHARPSVHDGEEEHDHDDFESFTLPLSPLGDVGDLIARLHETAAAHDILRIKGFAGVADKAMRLVVQGVGTRLHHYFDRPWGDGESRDGALVVIGLKGLDREAIARMITGG
ncbi:MAG: cobalamin biosynthesis protein CobW [Alphaproteobacteria bacterium]|nr:cobalamin biosynthesis protein CobW [Alphaproteobacteria bacterium]